jgi:hypothetical protein
MNALSLQNSNLIVIPHCLSKFPALSKLDLSFNRLESVDSAFLLNALPLLQNLNLSNNRIRNIAQIQVRYCSMQQLNCIIFMMLMIPFQELGKHTSLTALDLSCNPLQNCGQRVLLLQVPARARCGPIASDVNCCENEITLHGKCRLRNKIKRPCAGLAVQQPVEAPVGHERR